MPEPVSSGRDAPMAEMDGPSFSTESHSVGSVQRFPEVLSATPGQDCAQHAESVANLSIRGAGCRSPARPDLWEARGGNRSGLPDHKWHETRNSVNSAQRIKSVTSLRVRWIFLLGTSSNNSSFS